MLVGASPSSRDNGSETRSDKFDRTVRTDAVAYAARTGVDRRNTAISTNKLISSTSYEIFLTQKFDKKISRFKGNELLPFAFLENIP